MALLHMHIISQDYISDSLKTVSSLKSDSSLLVSFRKNIGIHLQVVIFLMQVM